MLIRDKMFTVLTFSALGPVVICVSYVLYMYVHLLYNTPYPCHGNAGAIVGFVNAEIRKPKLLTGEIVSWGACSSQA